MAETKKVNEYYSGCNYWPGNEADATVPAGHAVSMHCCGDCEWLDICTLKQESEIWPYNKYEHAVKLKVFIEQRNAIVQNRRNEHGN